jgi:hypothetical protein
MEEGKLRAPVDGMIWVCFAVALITSLYVLIQEPDEEPGLAVAQPLVQVRMLAVAASALGAVCGVWRVLTRHGDDDLLTMVVVFSLVLTTFWVLRIALAGNGLPAP